MTHASALFQKQAIIRGLDKAQPVYVDHNFLLQWGARALVERLDEIKRSFRKVLILSARESTLFSDVFPDADVTVIGLRTPVCDPEDLPLDSGPYDLILSLFDLHKMNDLPGVLVCLRRMLKPDGVFLACFPGGETLHELRASLLQAELNVLGGASPRVMPFVDKQQGGALLQRAGFSLPVVDSDILSVSYRDIFHLMADLRGMGEQNVLSGRYKRFTPSRVFFEAAKHYVTHFAEADGRIHASFELIFMIGWAPDDSQPQPLKRGSAKISLHDVL